MNRRLRALATVALATPLLAGCASNGNGTDAATLSEGPRVVATVDGTIGAVADATVDPQQLIDWAKGRDEYIIVSGVVEGVEYKGVTTREGATEPFDATWPMTFFIVRVGDADASVDDVLHVQVGGGYVPITSEDVAAAFKAPVTEDGELVEFEMPGDGAPPAQRDEVVLFLRPVTAPEFKELADYVVMGQSYGYFRADPDTGLYTQAAQSGDPVTLSDEQLAAALAP